MAAFFIGTKGKLMKLVIAEKPSVGKGLADVLGAKKKQEGYYEGNGYIVSWCIGHLVGLADAAKYDEKYGKWNREDLPIIPDEWKYVIFDNKKSQFNTLKRLLNRKDINEVICATDAGREGELIFRFVYEMSNCTKPIKRLWISSMEESAIKQGFNELKDGKDYENLYHSAICRAKADWLVGINATRLFSTLYNKTLNIGRVQTPTLAMIIERQNKISGFTKEKYYMVKLKLGDIEATSEQIKDKQEAEQIKAACESKQAVCLSLENEKKTIAPPKLFDLTALQREGNRLFGYTAQQTLDAAQKLYENKLITYPRTDSRFITTDMASSVNNLAISTIQKINASGLVTIDIKQIIDDSKVTDHHAIIPTSEYIKCDIDKLPETERKILLSIVYRFVMAIGEKYIYNAMTAKFECNGNEFTTKGNNAIAFGWKAIDLMFRPALGLKTNENKETIPEISEGQTFDDISPEVTEHQTQPPKPFTEDSLLAAMERAGVEETNDDAERKGLGTSATRAAIIEKLVSSGFVTRKGKQLLPTQDGTNLINIVPDELKTPLLTAEWENNLSKIANGETKPDDFIKDIENNIKDLVKDNTIAKNTMIRGDNDGRSRKNSTRPVLSR